MDLGLLVRQGSAHDLWPEVADALATDRLDLVDLATASPVLRFRVVRDGRLLFAEDARTENEFEMAAIREYRDTAHRRRIQDAYARRASSAGSPRRSSPGSTGARARNAGTGASPAARSTTATRGGRSPTAGPGRRAYVEGRDRNRRSIENDAVARLADGGMLAGEVKWGSKWADVSLHRGLLRELEDLAASGHGWARRCLPDPESARYVCFAA